MKKITKAFFLFLFSLSLPQPVHAVIPTGCGAHLINTGLGEIPTEPGCLAKWVLANGILMGGGLAFLLSIFGGLSIILAGGDPEKINQGKQIITSAITGILFIILSVFLLRLIGYDILKIPDFGL